MGEGTGEEDIGGDDATKEGFLPVRGLSLAGWEDDLVGVVGTAERVKEGMES